MKLDLKPTIDHIALAALTFAVIAIAAVSLVALTSAKNLRATNDAAMRTNRALQSLDALRFHSAHIQADEAAYALSRREDDLTSFRAGIAALESELAALAATPPQFAFVQNNLGELRNTARALVAHEQFVVESLRLGDRVQADSLIGSTTHTEVHRKLLDATARAANAGRQEIARLETEQTRIGEGVQRWILALISSSVFILIFLYGSLRKLHKEQVEAKDRFAHQANHDALTGLHNRKAVMDHVDQLLADEATAALGGIAVLLLDLDGFKTVNDVHGHDTGDALLCQAGARMRTALRDSDYLARLGGDEFLVVVPQVSEAATASRVAEKLVASLSTPFEVAGLTLKVTTSIGVSLSPQDGRSREALVKNADIALYSAKRAGRNQARLFTPDLRV